MIDNSGLLSDFLADGTIRMHDSAFLKQPPLPLSAVNAFDKIEGMLLGLAIGDAMGATSEGQIPQERQIKYGEIRGYLPGKRSDFKEVGVATDDTQFSFWTLEQLINDGGLNPGNLAAKFCKHRIVGIGNTTREFIRNYKDKHVPWYRAGIDSLGNGSLMRIGPVILPYVQKPHPSLWADAALDTMITHNSYANCASCVAFTSMLWQLAGMDAPPKPEWWIDEYCRIAKDLEGQTKYHVRSRSYSNYEGPLWRFTGEVCHDALARKKEVREACNSWGSGASLFETVPSVLFILASFGHDAQAAIVRAVNDTYDNDTVGAIVGAAVGALHGGRAFPQDWLKGLAGNIRIGGNKYQIFRLILLAKNRFWS